MKSLKVLVMVSVVVLFAPLYLIAADFDWTRDFNIRAEADASGFRARLATRFNIGDAQVDFVLGNVDRPADAYIVLRLGEMSARPTDYVIEQYKAGKGKGWGVIAKSLGIKPGSKEFHTLKRGSDLYNDRNVGKGKGKGKGKEKK
ncbi:MAG: hypothetical protein A4E65_01191 [Syntrophorhabdus sp. PtaU1.Bin153]|nr:MAG: hypothetical protein A4E65_01191 [Syntrophorhabdus sp. PtaU1.Bin153]